MSDISNAFKNALALHIFNNIAIANLGDATGLPASATAGNISVALHTADPGAGGTQATSEATFTGYARQNIARSSSGFTVSGGAASNTAAFSFPQCTAGGQTITHFSFGYNGVIIVSKALDVAKVLSVGDTINVAIGALSVTIS